jgi:hypothetical protein
MDLINRAANMFSEKRSGTLAMSIVYDDGTNVPYQITATYAEHSRLAEDMGGSQVTAIETQQDFIVRRADMLIEPRAGDRITADIGGVRVFEVSGYSGLPVTQNADPYRIDLRLHANEVTQ